MSTYIHIYICVYIYIHNILLSLSISLSLYIYIYIYVLPKVDPRKQAPEAPRKGAHLPGLQAVVEELLEPAAYPGRNQLGSTRFGSGLFIRKFIGSVRFGSVRFGSVWTKHFADSMRFGLRFSDASWHGWFGSFPRPVPAASRIEWFGSARFGRFGLVSYSFL